jgi:hypothetical protein
MDQPGGFAVVPVRFLAGVDPHGVRVVGQQAFEPHLAGFFVVVFHAAADPRTVAAVR